MQKISFTILLSCAIICVFGQNFTGFQISFAESVLREKNIKQIESFESFIFDIPLTQIWLNQTAKPFQFCTKVYNIKLKHKTNYTSNRSTLEKNALKINIDNAFVFDAEFNMDIDLASFIFISSKCTARLFADSINLYQNYTVQGMYTNLTAEWGVYDIKISGGLLGLLFGEAIQSLITEALAGKIGGMINENLRQVGVKINDNIYDEIMYIEWHMPGYSMILTNKITETSTLAQNNVQHQLFFLDTAASTNGVLCTYEPQSRSQFQPVYNIKSTTRVCIHYEVFSAVLSSKAYCGYLYEIMDPAEWGLNGRAAELFEIIPDLENYYPPDEPYTVTRDVLLELQPDFNEQGTVHYTKTYLFEIPSAQYKVFEMTTVFKVNIGIECRSHDDCSEVQGRPRSVTILEMNTDIKLSPMARAILLRHMNTEGYKMTQKPLFEPGVPLSFVPPHATKATDGKTAICIEYPTA